MHDEMSTGRFVRLATGGVVIYAVVVPLISLVRYLRLPPEQVDGYIVVLILCTVPALAWLVHAAAHGPLDRVHAALLVVLVAAAFGFATGIGPPGWGQLYVPTALVAIVLRPAWSVGFMVALIAGPAPLAIAVGHPEYALFWTLGVPFAILPLIIAVRLIRAVRALQTARHELATEAIVRERMRIDDDLGSTVATALTGMVAQGERIERQVLAGAPGAGDELRALSSAARRSLADARQLVRGYRETSLQAEVTTAGTLLAAAGIRARIEPHGEPLSDQDDADDARVALRAEIVRLLTAGDHPDGVVLPAGQHRFAIRTDEPPGPHGARR